MALLTHDNDYVVVDSKDTVLWRLSDTVAYDQTKIGIWSVQLLTNGEIAVGRAGDEPVFVSSKA